MALFVAVLGLVAVVAWRTGLFRYRDPAALAQAIRGAKDAGYAAPLFVAAYAVAATFGLPGSAFTLAGGAIFGLWVGLALNWLGAVLGATGAYTFARSLCGEACRALLGRHARALERLAPSRGFLTTLRLRLIPLVPFNLLNFAAALAGVRRRDYIAATALGIIPGTVVYTYFADSLLAGAAGAKRRALVHVAVAGALLIGLSFVPALVRKRGGRSG